MSQSTITLRKAKNNEAALFRDLRLKALQEAPEAFAQNLEEESNKPLTYWQELLDGLTPPSPNIMLIASKDKEQVGVVYGFNKGS